MTPHDNRGLERLAKFAIALASIMLLTAYLLVDTLGADGNLHANWIRTFPQQVLQGDLRPTWLSEASEGLGAPTFYFYPPLTYWLATPFYPLISKMSGASGYSLIAFIGSCFAFISFRFFLRTNGQSGSLLIWAPLLYAIAPFRIYELFTRSGLSAHIAVGFVPLVFAGIDGLAKGGRRSRYFALLALSYAGLLLSNLPVFVMTNVVVLIYFLIVFRRRRTGVGRILLALAVGVSITAFYLLPIPTLLQFVQSTKLMVVQGLPGDGVSAVMNLVRFIDITESAHSALNLLTALALVGLMTAYHRSKAAKEGPHLRFVLICAGLVLFFQTMFLSSTIWSIDAVRKLIQFPHRWSVILIFAMAIAYAMCDAPRIRRWVLAGVIVWGLSSAGFSALAAFDLRVHERGEIPAPLEPPEYATIYSPPDKGTVIATARAHAKDPQIAPVRALLPGESLGEIVHDPGYLRYQVVAKEPMPVIFQQWRWPLWELADGDGHKLKVGSDSTGRMIATLPVGSASYEVRLVESTEEKVGKYISLLGLLLLATSCVYLHKMESKQLLEQRPRL